MMKVRKYLFTAFAAAAVAFAQSEPSAGLSFEVASIRPSAPLSQQVTAGVHIDGAQVSCLLLSLRDYIRWAYKVKDYQISAPEWMAGARFDITAKVPPGTTPEQVGQMVQSMLTERFGMKLHHETRELPVYALAPQKGGAKLKESPKDPPKEAADAAKGSVNVVAQGDSGGTTVDMGGGASFSFGNNKIEGRKMGMAAFTETLASFTDKPVIDMTGLTGLYDFTLEFTPEDFRAMMIRAAVQRGVTMPPEALKMMDSAPGDSMGVALEKLGLTLESRKAPIDMLVIDHMEKAPTDN